MKSNTFDDDSWPVFRIPTQLEAFAKEPRRCTNCGVIDRRTAQELETVDFGGTPPKCQRCNSFDAWEWPEDVRRQS